MTTKAKKVPATKSVPEATTAEPPKVSKKQERISKYGDQPLYKTNEGERIRRQPAARRTRTYNAVQDGSTFNEAVARGADPGDLLDLLRWKNVMTTPECDTSGAENGRYARAFPDAPAKPVKKATKKAKSAKK